MAVLPHQPLLSDSISAELWRPIRAMKTSVIEKQKASLDIQVCSISCPEWKKSNDMHFSTFMTSWPGCSNILTLHAMNCRFIAGDLGL